MNNNIHKFPKLPRSLLLISLLLSYEGTLRHLNAAGVGIGFEPTVATCILFTFLVFGPLLAVCTLLTYISSAWRARSCSVSWLQSQVLFGWCVIEQCGNSGESAVGSVWRGRCCSVSRLLSTIPSIQISKVSINKDREQEQFIELQYQVKAFIEEKNWNTSLIKHFGRKFKVEKILYKLYQIPIICEHKGITTACSTVQTKVVGGADSSAR